MLVLLLVLLVGLPIVWLISEFQPRVWLRVVLGVVAIGLNCFVAYAVGSALTHLNYNAWYGTASANLLETVITHLESGDEEALLRELKRLDGQFQPTYENRAGYDKLVEEFVDRLNATSHEKGVQAAVSPDG